ncbi:MAG: efflux RND transporter periplasmic adaptor subunit [Candidatus Pacebacteria bacterium]|nr:efflux RND transporter periplasmic adaptor subunit [Candidatus Paceibacterota bacterium]MDR3583546.1 efflux RND transporter periplasmic adaptor subunit [Candidatus Paceibacterota bacterium]
MFRKKKTYVIISIILLIVGGVYYAKSKKPATLYTTEQATRGNLTRTVSVTGTIIPPVQSDVAFKMSGRVVSLRADVGDHVIKGQTLATIDTGILSSQLVQAEQELAAQKKTLASMQRKGASYSYFDKQSQEAVIKQGQASVSQIQTQLGYATLYAPISGMIIKKNVEVGEMAMADAMTSDTSIFTIASDGQLETQVEVPESDIINVALGQKAQVTLDAFPATDILDGVVDEVDPASTVVQDVVYYDVKLKFPKPDPRLKVGMSTNVDINTAEKDNVVMVPQRAIKTDNNSHQQYVEVLSADGKSTRRVNIQTGLTGDDAMVEVTSGTTGGENVVVLSKAS